MLWLFKYYNFYTSRNFTLTRMPNSNRLHSAPCAGKKPYQLSVDEVLNNLQSQSSGLTQNEASARLARDGANALPEKAGKPAWLRFLTHFHDVLIYVLIAAAALTAIMGHWGRYRRHSWRGGHQRPDWARSGKQRREIAKRHSQYAFQRRRGDSQRSA